MGVSRQAATSTGRIRVFLVDDHDLVLRGLQDILRGEPDMQVVGTAGEGSSLVEKVRVARADVVLLDVRMAHFDVFESVAALHSLPDTQPAARAPYVILVTAYADAYMVSQAQKLGVRGYLLKEEALGDKLPHAIRRVARGGCAYSSEAQKMLYDPDAMPEGLRFGGAQYTVLALMVSGKTPTQIADILGKSMDSIYTIQSRIRAKLEVDTNAQAVRKAIRDGIVPHSPQ